MHLTKALLDQIEETNAAGRLPRRVNITADVADNRVDLLTMQDGGRFFVRSRTHNFEHLTEACQFVLEILVMIVNPQEPAQRLRWATCRPICFDVFQQLSRRQLGTGRGQR
jgi:hypothetical protein